MSPEGSTTCLSVKVAFATTLRGAGGGDDRLASGDRCRASLTVLWRFRSFRSRSRLALGDRKVGAHHERLVVERAELGLLQRDGQSEEVTGRGVEACREGEARVEERDVEERFLQGTDEDGLVPSAGAGRDSGCSRPTTP